MRFILTIGEGATVSIKNPSLSLSLVLNTPCDNYDISALQEREPFPLEVGRLNLGLAETRIRSVLPAFNVYVLVYESAPHEGFAANATSNVQPVFLSIPQFLDSPR